MSSQSLRHSVEKNVAGVRIMRETRQRKRTAGTITEEAGASSFPGVAQLAFDKLPQNVPPDDALLSPYSAGSPSHQQTGNPTSDQTQPTLFKEELTTAQGLHGAEVDEDDDDEITDNDEKMNPDHLTIQITPTFTGFQEHVRRLNPNMEATFLVDRIAHQQELRYNHLILMRMKHQSAIASAKCRSGLQCMGLGGSAILLDSAGNHQQHSALPTIINSSDAERNSEGRFFRGQRLFGVPMPAAFRLPAEFECQLCFRVKKIQRISDWKKHVFEDVEPFTCTHSDCPEPKLFKRKLDWVRHENEHHRPTRPQDEPCKFCGETYDFWGMLRLHLEKHMENIVLPILELVEQQFVNGNTINMPVWPPPQQSTSLRQRKYQSSSGDSGYLSQVPERDSHQLSPFSAYVQEQNTRTPAGMDIDHYIRSQAVKLPPPPTPKYYPVYSCYPSPANKVQACSPEPANFKNDLQHWQTTLSILEKPKSAQQARDMNGIEYINKEMMRKEEKEDDKKTTFEQPKNHTRKVEDEFIATFPMNLSKPSINDGEETAPHAKNQLAELDVNTLGKASPFPPQSQDDESESTCETESDMYEDECQSDESSCRAAFDDRQEDLFTKILKEFWCVWNKNTFDSSFRECTKESGKTNSTCVAQSQSTSSAIAPSATSNQARVNGKRNCSEDEDDHPSDDRNQGPNKPEGNSMPIADETSAFRLACPFRKHNTRKYNMHHPTWKACAISSFESVARTKEHLYRKHTAPIQCVRCWIFFKSMDDLNIHISAINICAIRPGQPIEGLSSDIEKKLRSRKRASSDQSEEDRWRRMYGTIFPNEEVPSPFFEPVLDDLAHIQESAGFPIEEFMRQQLPQALTRRLEIEVFNMDLADDTVASDDRTRLREIFATIIPRLVNEAVEDVSSAHRQRSSGDMAMSNGPPTPPPSYTVELSQTPIRAVSHTASVTEKNSNLIPQPGEPILSQTSQNDNIQVNQLEFDTAQELHDAGAVPALSVDAGVAQSRQSTIIQTSALETRDGVSEGLEQLEHNVDIPQLHQMFDWPQPIDWEAEFDQMYSNDQGGPRQTTV